MQRERAETIALKALAWLASNDELLPVFLGSSGASAEDMKHRANDPEFLGSVLDFLTADDDWIIAFCDAESLDYDQPLRARYVLPGGEKVEWT